MTQQLKFSDSAGTTLPIILSQGSDETYPYQGGKRDCIDFHVLGDAITTDALDALTADAANTRKLVLITDDGDVHTEAEMVNYVLRVGFGKKTVMTSPGSSTTPPTYEERMHVVLAQQTYDEVQRDQQAASIAEVQDAITELAFGGEA